MFDVGYIGDCDIVKPYKPLSLYESIQSDQLEVTFVDFAKNNSEIKLFVKDTDHNYYNNVTVGL